MQEHSTPKLRRPDVLKLCGGISTQTLYNWIAKASFPKPRRLGLGRIVVWDASEVNDWLNRQERSTAGDKVGKTGLAPGQFIKHFNSERAAREVHAGLALVAKEVR